MANEIERHDDEAGEASTPAERKANESTVAMKPAFRHSLVGGTLAHNTAGFETMEWKHSLAAYNDACTKTQDGDLSLASNMLTSQAMTLDAVFTEMLSRATNNLGKYPEAVERYMRMALKAQSQSRASLETLVRMHQPREQTVRHVYVGPSGQAVFIENLHGGLGNGRTDEQPYAQSPRSPALLSQDAGGNGVPLPSREGPATVPNARRGRRKRRANRQ